MSTEVPNQSPEQSNTAAAKKRKRATNAQPSASTRSRRKGAKTAQGTPPNPQRNKIAGFILRKYVKPEKIVYGRDMPIAYKLADRHFDLGFWQAMPIRNQVDTLIMLWTQEARRRLTREWENYSKKIENQKKIVLDEPATIYTIGDKVGEDYVPTPKKPRNALEFCR